MSTAANSPSIAVPFGTLLPAAPPAPVMPSGSSSRSPSVFRQVATIEPYRLTVAQLERMIQSGVLTKFDRGELIRGELIQKMTLGDAHMAAVKRLNHLLQRCSGNAYVVGVQDAVKLADSRPDPDISVSKFRSDFYASATVQPPDILLLIEVADTSLEYDREVKLPLYAENGVQDYWIVNLIDSCIEIYRQPQGGDYADRQVIRRGENIAPLAFPALAVAAADILDTATEAESAG